MKLLIIYAHPDEIESHASVILREVENNLKVRKINYEVIDLYRIKYDPILKSEELYSAGRRHISKQNLEFQKKISESNCLVFIYPVWWGSMPAILKGFFDRVYTPGFAFRFEKGGYVKKLLEGKRAVVFLTMGAPRIFSTLLFGDRASKLIKNDILGFFGIKTKVYQIGSARKLNDKVFKRIKNFVDRGMCFLCD